MRFATTSVCLVVSLVVGLAFPQLWPEIAVLTASNKAISDRFGSYVSLTDNYVLAGAWGSNTNGITDAGAAYVFARSGSTWIQQAILTASSKVMSDWFGASVSLTDNYALIGAHGSDPDFVQGAGAAYIFLRTGNNWNEQAILTASNKAGNDQFGFSVSLTDDYALVGARSASPGSKYQAGAAYIFSRSGTAWNEQAILTASNKANNDVFGSAVSLSDSYALIGVFNADLGSVENAGAAHVFFRSGTTWTEQAILTASEKIANHQFGAAVSLTDEYAIVGLSFAPKTYIFSRSGTTWNEHQILNVPAGFNMVAISNNYAIIKNIIFTRSGNLWLQEAVLSRTSLSSVAITDSYATISDSNAFPDGLSQAGEVYILRWERSSSQSQSQSQSASPEPIVPGILSYSSTRSGLFGHTVSFFMDKLFASRPQCIDTSSCDGGRGIVFDKDSNGDWQPRQAIRGRHRNIDAQFGNVIATSTLWLAVASNSTLYHGAGTAIVHIFKSDPSSSSIVRVAGLRPKSISNNQNMKFGHSVAIGPVDAVVGAPAFNLDGKVGAGAFMSYRFRAAADVWGRNPVVTSAYDAAVADHFGHSLSLEGTYLAVANNPDSPARQAVYIMTKNGFEFVHLHKIQAQTMLGFGWAVLLHNDELVVGAPEDSSRGATNGGSVTVFAKNSTGHFQEYKTIVDRSAVAHRRFGHALSRHQDRLVIGTNTCASGAPCALPGRAYLYTKAGQDWDFVRFFTSGAADGSDSFGTSVAVDADDVAIGAPKNNGGSGSVFTFAV